MSPEDRAYRRFRDTGDPGALGELYDRTADRLLRAALCVAPGPAAAEDLVQATFVLAIERAPDFDPGRPVLPWLLGILANQAKLARWRENRAVDPARVRRGAGAGAGRPDAAPADAAQDRELHDAIERAIDGLPATYRPVLVLRFVHGMEPAEIAHALGRPPGTVRSQLARGLDLVRRCLPASFASGVAALLGAQPARGLAAVREAVLAQVPAAAAGVAAGAGLAFTIGGILMKKTAIAAAAAALALAIGYAAWPADAEPIVVASADAVDARPSTTDAGLLVRPPGLRERVAAPAPPETDDAAPAVAAGAEVDPDGAVGALSIQVVWGEGGEPAARVHVLVQTRRFTQWSERTVVVTDAGGRARVDDLPPGPANVRTVRGGEQSVVVRPGLDTEVRLAVPRGLDVEGIVVDGDGVAVAGAGVWLSEPWRINRGQVVAHTDELGRFALEHVGRDRYLAVRASGFEPSRLYPVKGVPGTAHEFRIALARGGASVHGRVVDPAGQRPVGGARVLIGAEQRAYDRQHDDGTWLPGPPPVELRAGSDGRFVAHGLEVGDGGRLPFQVRAPGFAPWRGAVDVAAFGRTEVEIELEPGATLAGTVTADDGAAVGYALVRAGDAMSFGSAAVSADRNGAFRLEGLPAGALPVHASHLEHGAVDDELVLVAGHEQRWDPVLGPRGEVPNLLGKLVDAAGEPLNGWRIAVRAADDPSQTRGTSTVRGGRFELFVPWPRFRLWAHGRHGWSEFPPLLRDDVVADGREQVLRVPDQALTRASLRGRVLDRAGRPVSVQVQMWLAELELWREYTNDPRSGAFEIAGIPPGTCHINVRPQGHPWIRIGARVLRPGAELDLGDVTVKDGIVVSGAVRMRGGGALPASLDFSVADQDGRDAAVVQYTDGEFRTGALAPGRYTISVHGERVVGARVTVEIAPGAAPPAALDVALERGALRRIRFALAERMPRPRFLAVNLRDAQGRLAWNQGVGRDGPMEFAISAAPGRYELQAFGPGGLLFRDESFVIDGYADRPPVTLTLSR